MIKKKFLMFSVVILIVSIIVFITNCETKMIDTEEEEIEEQGSIFDEPTKKEENK